MLFIFRYFIHIYGVFALWTYSPVFFCYWTVLFHIFYLPCLIWRGICFQTCGLGLSPDRAITLWPPLSPISCSMLSPPKLAYAHPIIRWMLVIVKRRSYILPCMTQRPTLKWKTVFFFLYRLSRYNSSLCQRFQIMPKLLFVMRIVSSVHAPHPRVEK